jgi:lipid-A-disaccharide synthase
MAASRRVLVSAGDPSGDLILAAIIRELREIAPGRVEFAGLCGPACEAEGVRVLARAQEVAVVGIWEVLRKLRTIFGALGRLREELPACDSLLCVDFPDFNLKLAGMAAQAGKPVDYVVAPQVWAWRSGRMEKIRRLVRRLYPALPFEEEIFRDAGVDARFFGHPVRDLLQPRNRAAARRELDFETEADTVVFALMPGSRRSEIDRHLELLIDAWDKARPLRQRKSMKAVWKGVLPLAPGWDYARFKEGLPSRTVSRLEELVSSGEWKIVSDSRQALMASDFGWIASGTATLEAAYYQVPHVLIYRLSGLSAWLIRSSTSYFEREEAAAGLPNILLGRNVIPELLQRDLSDDRLAAETVELLADGIRMGRVRKSLRFLPKRLGEPGVTRRVAEDLARL